MTSDVNRPVLGEPGAPCRTCGAPLAADQRYCLQCGTRRAEARLPFLDILARQAPAAAAPPATTTARHGPGTWLGRLSTNAAAVAGVACLLLALGVGVLIGGLGDDSAASGGAGAPQVISVGGAAPAAVATPSTTAPPVTETTPEPGAPATVKAKKKAKAESKATNSAVKRLDETSGTDYSKKSEKLPKEVGTGGKAPPKDTSGKDIGGGSDVEELG